MDERMLRFLKEWLRENLEIDKRGDYDSNSVSIVLRFKGDKDDFASVFVHIPDGQ